MKRKNTLFNQIFFSLVLIILCSITIKAAEPTSSGIDTTVRFKITTDSMTIDGIDNETGWADAVTYEAKMVTYNSNSEYIGVDNYLADGYPNKVYFKGLYNETHDILYLHIKVNDPTPQNNGYTGYNAYYDDLVELGLDLDNSKSTYFSYPDDYLFYCKYDSSYITVYENGYYINNYYIAPDTVNLHTEGYYTVEYAIPIGETSTSATIGEGSLIGFNISVNFNEDNDNYGRELQINWSDVNDNGDPDYFGTAVIGNDNQNLYKLEITSPMDGEEFHAGDTIQVDYTNTLSGSTDMSLYYSTDGGNTYSNYSTYSNVPNTQDSLLWITSPTTYQTDQAKVKIRYYDQGYRYLESNYTFSIIEPRKQIAIENISNWQFFTQNTGFNIEFTSYSVNRINAYYSLDEGATWNTIVTNYSNFNSNATYEILPWTIPGISGNDTCIIKIEDSDSIEISVLSPEFIISDKSALEILSPNGGEEWEADINRDDTIAFIKHDPNYLYFYIDISYDGGESFTSYNSKGSSDSGNDTMYFNHNSYFDTTSQALIRLRGDDGTIYDVSDGIFNINEYSGTDGYLSIENITYNEYIQIDTSFNLQVKSLNVSSIDILVDTLSGYSTSYDTIAKNIPCTDGINDILVTIPFYVSLSGNNSSSIKIIESVSESVNATQSIYLSANNIYYDIDETTMADTVWIGSSSNLSFDINFNVPSNTYIYTYISTDNGNTWTSIGSDYIYSSSSTETLWFTINSDYIDEKIEACSLKIISEESPYENLATKTFVAMVPAIEYIAPLSGTYLPEEQIALDFAYYASDYQSVNIYYRENSEDSWHYYINTYTSPDETHTINLTIPSDIESTDAFQFKVVFNNSYLDQIYDLSPNLSITAPIPQPEFTSISEPDPDEYWETEDKHTLNWNSKDIDIVDIYLSLDGGNTYSALIENYNSAVYGTDYIVYFDPIDELTRNARIKITDHSNPETYIESGLFTLSNDPPMIELISPLGGESIRAGKDFLIEFNNKGYYTRHRIYYSTDMGATWNQLLSTYLDPGYNNYLWQLTDELESDGEALIMVKYSSNYNGQEIAAVSDPFSILPHYPKTEFSDNYQYQYYVSGQMVDINYQSIGSANIKIQYSDDNKATWNDINSLSTFTGYFTEMWTVPALTTMKEYSYFRLVDATTGMVYDSTKRFTLSPSYMPVTITFPSDNNTVTQGESFNLVTKSQQEITDRLSFNVSTDKGKSWNYLSYTNTDIEFGESSFSLNISDIYGPTDSCLLMIKAYYNDVDTFAISNYFNLQPKPAMLAFDMIGTGDYFVGGDTIYFELEGSQADTVLLYYSLDGKTTWNLFNDTLVANSTIYPSWIIPDVTEDKTMCNLKAVSKSTPSLLAISNTFTVAKDSMHMILLSPVGGESYTAGEDIVTVVVDNKGPDTYMEAWLHAKDLGQDTYLGDRMAQTGENAFNFDIPETTYASGKVQLSVVEFNNNLFDTTDTDISIIGAPKKLMFQYLSTNYLIPGDNQGVYLYTIQVDSVLIELSTDGGETWTKLDTMKVTNGENTYWFEPTWISGIERNCMVKVSELHNSDLYGMSGAFTINNVGPSIMLTAPNGGEVYDLDADPVIPIQFNAEFKNAQEVHLYYSANSGSSWNAIELWDYTYPGENTYNWQPNVNNIDSLGTYRVMVVNANDADIADTSDANFTIQVEKDEPAPVDPYLTIQSPTENTVIHPGDGFYIEWITNVDTINIFYSVDNGSTWTLITENYYMGSDGYFSYYWTTPNIDSIAHQSLVKIESVDHDGIVSISEPFIIGVLPKSLTLLSPAGGEEYNYDTDQITVAYEYTGERKRFDFYISPDAGYTWDYISRFYLEENGEPISFMIKDDLNMQKSSDSCMLRVIEDIYTYSNVLFDETPLFTINVPEAEPEINVTEPDGGETYLSGEKIWFDWNSQNVEAINIDISLDGGSTWERIADKLEGSGSQSYPMTLPEVDGVKNQCILKATDVNNSNNTDQTGWFTIVNAQSSLTIIQPTGGNEYTAGQPMTVTFEYTGPEDNYQDVFISYNGGENWDYLPPLYYGYGDVKNGTNYLYGRLPSDLEYSPDCKVRTEVYTNYGTLIAENEGTFTVHLYDPSIEITNIEPNDLMESGTIQEIRWNSKQVLLVDILLSKDAGVTWETLESGYAAEDGFSYSWEVPKMAMLYPNCRIKVMDHDNNSIMDVSPTFLAGNNASSITLQYPEGGEIFNAGQGFNINFLYDIAIGVERNVTFYMTYNNEDYFYLGSDNVFNPNNYSDYNYIPEDAPGTDMARIIATDGKSADTTGLFSIVPSSPYITIANPQDGWVLSHETNVDVIWNEMNVGNKTLKYTSDGGANWTILENDYANTLFTWAIPTVSSPTPFQFVVSDNGSNTADTADILVTNLGMIYIDNPSEGEFYKSGMEVNTAISSDKVDTISIKYSINGGSTWNTLEQKYPVPSDYFTYYWMAPVVESTTEVLLVVTNISGSISDTVTMYISNDQAITLNNQLEGSTVASSQSLLLDMTAFAYGNFGFNYNYISAKLSTDNGSTWMNFDSWYNYFAIEKRDYAENFYLPEMESPSSECLIVVQISNYNGTMVYASDTSGLFTIAATPASISISEPDAGEFWNVGSIMDIDFNATNVEQVDISYSTNGGNSWNNIVSGYDLMGDGYTYPWTVPAVNSNNAYIKIVQTGNANINDISGPFSLINEPLGITISTPQAGDMLYKPDPLNIGFNFNGNPQYVNTLLSIDNGMNWIPITSNTAEYGYNNFTGSIPSWAKTSDECKVKAELAGNTNIFDITDGLFSFMERPQSTIIADVSIPDNYVHSGDFAYIIWESFNTESVDLLISYDNGLTYTTIAEGVASTDGNNNYNWQVPVIDKYTEKALVKVQNAANSNVSDLSSTFTINPLAESFTVMAPNGGELYVAGNTIPTMIDYNGKTRYVKFELSLNNGVSWQTYRHSYIHRGIETHYLSIGDFVPTSSECLIRVVDDYSNQELDRSDDVFNITNTNSELTWNSHSFYGIKQSGDMTMFSWNEINIEGVDILYSLDGGASWTTIEENHNENWNGGALNWKLPDVSGRVLNAVVKIVSSNDPSVFITSSPFGISSIPDELTVLSPNGGEVYQAGNIVELEYEYYGPNSRINIYFSENNGQDWEYIDRINTSEYSYGINTFDIPIPINTQPTSQGLLRLTSDDLADMSDNVFTIENPDPFIMVYNPGSNTYIGVGEILPIQWGSSGVESVNIAYSTDNGSNWTDITTNLTNISGVYNWVVPASITGFNEMSLIKIEDASASTVFDVSNTFAINGSVMPSISITQPTSTDTTNSEDGIWIEYENKGPAQNVKISLFDTDAEKWIASTTDYAYTGVNTDRLYTGQISNIIKGKLKIEYQNNGSIFAMQENPFTIMPGSNAYLDDLQVNWESVPGFSPNILSYDVTLPYGSSTVPEVSAPTSADYAFADITPATGLPGTTTILVTAEDQTTTMTYVVNFTVSGTQSSDATLSSIYINGDYLSGFSSGTVSYNKEFPFGTTIIPVVTATANDKGAKVEITQSTTVDGSATIKVTAEDGSVNNYTINFSVATGQSSDATLSNISVDYSTITGFSPSMYEYNYELSYGTTVLPNISYNVNYDQAYAETVTPGALPGDYIINVTAEDGSKQAYTIHFTVAATPSNDANLTAIMVNGFAIPDFDPADVEYDYELPFGTTSFNVTFTTSHAKASVVKTAPASVPGDYLLTVTSESKTVTKVYTVHLTMASAPSSDATLSMIMINGNPLSNFVSTTYSYDVVLPFGSSLPTITATTSHAAANYTPDGPSALPGTATITVQAQDGSTQDYTLNFTLGDPNNAPEVANAIANLSIPNNQPTTTKDLSAVFTDADGDALTYTATSSNTSIATVSVNGNSLVITLATSPQLGNTSVEVTATDGTDNASFTFTVTVYEANAIKLLSLGKLDVYPNPSDGNFVVEFDNTNWINAKMVITNIVGAQVYRGELPHLKNHISINDLGKGEYYISIVKNKKVVSTRKIMIIE